MIKLKFKVESTYLYDAFDCLFLSRHVRLSQWIHTLNLSEYQELLFQNKREIWSFIDCKKTRTYNNLFHKQTFNQLAKLTKWQS